MILKQSTITQHSSTIDVGGNMMINSNGNVNILASNINVAGNALINVDGDLNIASQAETTKSSTENSSIKIDKITLSKESKKASASASIKGEGNKYEESNTVITQKVFLNKVSVFVVCFNHIHRYIFFLSRKILTHDFIYTTIV